MFTVKRLATTLSAKAASKGMLIRVGNGKFGKILSKKETTNTGTVFIEYKALDDSEETGKLRVRSYETLEVIDSRMIVEVEKVDNSEGVLHTSAKKGLDKIKVPISLIPSTIVDIKPGMLLNIVMEGDDFVTVEFEGYRNSRSF